MNLDQQEKKDTQRSQLFRQETVNKKLLKNNSLFLKAARGDGLVVLGMNRISVCIMET